MARRNPTSGTPERVSCEGGTVLETPMGRTSPTYFLPFLTLLSLFACGGQVSSDGHGSTARGTGGSASNHAGAGGQILAGAGGAAGAVVAGAAGASAVCPVEKKVEAPTLSTDCQIAIRRFDPALTCANTDCAITKALDLTYLSTPDQTSLSDMGISVTTNGSVVMFRTYDNYAIETRARIMTIAATDSRVEDLSDTALPTSTWSSASAVDSSGAKWLFAGDGNGAIIAARGTNAGWTRTTILPSSFSDNAGANLTGASMVDDILGYLTYTGIRDQAPHLVTWDGSCWMDEAIGRPKVQSMVVQSDSDEQPWVAWISTQDSGAESLHLRSPNGDTQDLLAQVKTDARMDGKTIRLLPGGLDGTASVPTVVVRFTDGIRAFLGSQKTDSGWTTLLLPESAPAYAGTNDCISGGAPDFGNFDACAGMTTCSGQGSGAGAGFDLARTHSGAVYAAWVIYSGQATYAPKTLCERSTGEMGPRCYCGYTETSGTGKADLVVARLTGSEPIVSHFPFDMGGAVRFDSAVAMAARGDTLVVAAYLSDQTVPTLTYVEIDSTLLH
jgi:hypothetical protein